jgi:hypothetical protein
MSTISEKEAKETLPGGTLVGKNNEITDNASGGLAIGRSHKENGIKAINKATGQHIEFEGGEVIITKPAVEDNELREFEGQMLTNRQILSKINESGGGVSFAEKGLELPTELYCSGKSYKYGGETLTDYEITQKISKCGCSHDDEEKENFADGGEVKLSKKQKQEIIDSQNIFWESNDVYKLSNNGLNVLRKDNTLNPPRYKFYQSFEDFHDEIKQREVSKIELENAKKVFEYLEENGAELQHKSIYGSRYYNYKGEPIRVSNHWQTSEIKDSQTGLNKYRDIPSFYSNKKEGYKEMIVQIENLFNKETFADGGELEFKRSQYNNPNITFDNFHINTFTNYKQIKTSEIPNKEPNFVSNSGSKYWYIEETEEVIRQSNHWGRTIASCNWLLDGYSVKKQSQGISKLSDFHREFLSLLNNDNIGKEFEICKTSLEYKGNGRMNIEILRGKYVKSTASFYVFDDFKVANQTIAYVKPLFENFAYGGELEDKLNFFPSDIEEFKESLKNVLDNSLDLNYFTTIQTNYFEEVVSKKPKENLADYYEAIQIIPFNKREYFEHWFYEIESIDFQQKLNENPYNLLPNNFKTIPKIKKIDFSPTPDNANLGKITDLFVNRDSLRPIMSGVYFNLEDERIEATDGHILLFINEKPHVSKSCICVMGKTKNWYQKKSKDENWNANNEGCFQLEGKYMNTGAVVPTDYNYIVTVNARELLQYSLAASKYFTNKITRQISVVFTTEEGLKYRHFDAGFLNSALEGILLLGYDEVDFCFMEAKNRAVAIVPKGNSRKISYHKINTDLVLTMPLVNYEINEFQPVYNLDNNEKTLYYKAKNNFINQDETVELNQEVFEPTIEVEEISNLKEEIPDNSKVLKEVLDTINENEQLQDTINGLEILLETAKGKNKANIIDTIEGLKLLLNNDKFADGGKTDILLAPNGKPSNLNHTQWHLVRTPEFKNWFGDWENDVVNASKVVDENGEPLVVYHGTKSEFNIFDLSKAGISDSGLLGKAFYFTPSKRQADSFSKSEQYGYKGNSKTLECFLNLREPAIIQDSIFPDGKSLRDVHPNGITTKTSNSINKKLKSKKYDGSIFKLDDEILQLVAFEPNQIKLADGTNTTFDKNSNDIRFDNGGLLLNKKENLEFTPIQTPLN